MSSSSNTPPVDGYFNDLSQSTGNDGRNKRKSPPAESNEGAGGSGGDSNVPKLKRIACIICRKRKLKCDGSKPACSTCKRLGHNCAYDEVRRKSGPKRGYVKALEERLKQVETLLKTQEPVVTTAEVTSTAYASGPLNNTGVGTNSVSATNFNPANPLLGLGTEGNAESWGFNGQSPQPPIDLNFSADMNMNMGMDDSTFTWEMIGLGLEEPLPPQETIDDLHQIYFDKIHPSLPMIHKFRYLAAMNLAPNQRPPVALRYAMWTLAASVTEKYMDLKDHFYQRSRKYIETDSLKGHGEHMISVAHAQTHCLLASYEFKMMYFPRAWMSTGAAIRMCQMMGLHRLDGKGLDVKQCLPPPRDWTEKEERRRTFWMAFCEDRYASIGTGWPMTVDEKDILTDLPASEEAFELSREEPTQTLNNAMSPSGASKLSSFGAIVLMACLFGRNLIHLHRPDSDDRDDDLNGAFWKRHRSMDNILLNTSLSMPSHLKLPNGLQSPNIVFVNMNIHTSTICLHQAAIYKADKNRLPGSISAESKVRCITAANEIAGVMRLISHLDLATMNPFISFCLYVAARVFVQYLKSKPEDSQTGDSLRFLLSAMNAMKVKNPLTESFMVQLDVDLEGLGMRGQKYKSVFAYSEDHLGVSTSRLKHMGLHTDGIEKGQVVNQCSFLRVSEDVAPAEKSPEPRRESDPTSASSSGPQNYTGWGPMDHGDRHVQQMIRDATFGTKSFNQGRSSGYGNSESQSSNTEALSPDTGSASNRPTPNSSTASDRPSLHPPNRPSTNTSTSNSYETSPVISNQHDIPSNSANRPMGSFFQGQPDYSNISANGRSTGLTPGNEFSMPDTPGRGFAWEMSAPGGSTGLTPVGDGVFRQLMGLGPLDPMDLGWEGSAT